MLVTTFTKRALLVRREDRVMKAQGFKLCEPDWRLIRGGDWGKALTDIRIAADGQHIWFKIA